MHQSLGDAISFLAVLASAVEIRARPRGTSVAAMIMAIPSHARREGSAVAMHAPHQVANAARARMDTSTQLPRAPLAQVTQ